MSCSAKTATPPWKPGPADGGERRALSVCMVSTAFENVSATTCCQSCWMAELLYAPLDNPDAVSIAEEALAHAQAGMRRASPH